MEGGSASLAGILQHNGALVLTNKTLSISSVKTKTVGSGLDHARFDVWMVPNVAMHALNSKKNFWNDEAIDIMIGCRYGTINASVDDLPKEGLVRPRHAVTRFGSK